jgi:hypothetical protein
MRLKIVSVHIGNLKLSFENGGFLCDVMMPLSEACKEDIAPKSCFFRAKVVGWYY